MKERESIYAEGPCCGEDFENYGKRLAEEARYEKFKRKARNRRLTTAIKIKKNKEKREKEKKERKRTKKLKKH